MTDDTVKTRRVRKDRTVTLTEISTGIEEPAVAEPAVAEPAAYDIEKLRSILAVPKTKDSVPTLTGIDKGFYKRYFILDVDGDAYREAWRYYKDNAPKPTPDEFVVIVLRILEHDLPRMYRKVSFVPLI